jgi:TonB family protein
MRACSIAAVIVTCAVAATSLAATGSVSSPPPDLTRLLLYAPAPEYPAEAVQRYIAGTDIFLLRVQIKSGRVAQVIVGRSTGNRLLDAAAVKALRQLRFRPNAVPYRKITSVRMSPPQSKEETLVKLPVTFTLKKV